MNMLKSTNRHGLKLVAYVGLFGLIISNSTRAEAQADAAALQILGDHWTKKEIVELASEQGSRLLSNIDRAKYDALLKYWEPQLPAYCGVCSAVIVTNTLKQTTALNQKSFFTTDVCQIIAPETVSRIGLTLRELQLTLSSLNPDFTVEKFYTFNSGLDLFKEQLRNYENSDGMMITNFSIASLSGKGMNNGHFSIIAGYDKKTNIVLVLEVNKANKSYWLKSDDLFTAMAAIDPVSKIPRGWITVKQKQGREDP